MYRFHLTCLVPAGTINSASLYTIDPVNHYQHCIYISRCSYFVLPKLSISVWLHVFKQRLQNHYSEAFYLRSFEKLLSSI